MPVHKPVPNCDYPFVDTQTAGSVTITTQLYNINFRLPTRRHQWVSRSITSSNDHWPGHWTPLKLGGRVCELFTGPYPLKDQKPATRSGVSGQKGVKV